MEKEAKFNEIVAENSVRIKRICSYYNSDLQDQKDMFQEVLVNIWKSLDGFKGASSINTWIYRIAVNTSLSYTGKTYRRMKLIVNTDTQNLCDVLDEDCIGIKQLQEKQFEMLQNALNMLSVIDKALISLMLEGLSMKDIASVIGISESNVKVKIHRIKAQLKKQLTEGGYDDEK